VLCLKIEFKWKGQKGQHRDRDEFKAEEHKTTEDMRQGVSYREAI